MSTELMPYSIDEACEITGMTRDELFNSLTDLTAVDDEQGLPVKINRSQARKLFDSGDFTVSFAGDYVTEHVGDEGRWTRS